MDGVAQQLLQAVEKSDQRMIELEEKGDEAGGASDEEGITDETG